MSERRPDRPTDPLNTYWDELLSWNNRIRLVAPGDVANGWRRHIEDSVQLARHFPQRRVRFCDLGSGGGLPAIPIAIERRRHGHQDATVLIDADERKAVFLRHACRHAGVDATVIAERIERARPQDAEVVTARALAPLERLLGHVRRHLAPSGFALLPKGRSVAQEIAAARRRWSFEVVPLQSETAPDSTVLKVSEIKALTE